MFFRHQQIWELGAILHGFKYCILWDGKNDSVNLVNTQLCSKAECFGIYPGSVLYVCIWIQIYIYMLWKYVSWHYSVVKHLSMLFSCYFWTLCNTWSCSWFYCCFCTLCFTFGDLDFFTTKKYKSIRYQLGTFYGFVPKSNYGVLAIPWKR